MVQLLPQTIPTMKALAVGRTQAPDFQKSSSTAPVNIRNRRVYFLGNNSVNLTVVRPVVDIAERTRVFRTGQKTILISGYPSGASINGNGVSRHEVLLNKPVSLAETARRIREVLDAD